MAGNWELGSSDILGDVLDISVGTYGLKREPLKSFLDIDVGERADFYPHSDEWESIKKALLNLQRAWGITENVSKISSTVLVNKFQCERIADHFRLVAKVLEDLGLDKGFAGCQVLDGGLMRFSISTSAGRPLIDRNIGTKRFALSSFTHGVEHRKLNFLVNDKPMAVSELVAFIGTLLKKLIEGRDLILIHRGLKEVNNEIVDKTGPHGERFTQLHRELDELLRRHSVRPLTFPLKPDYDSTIITSEILKSLENNKTLQELRIDHFSDYNVELFTDLLVEHNFTLKTICLGSERYSIEDFIELVLEPLAKLGREYISFSNSKHVQDQDIDPKTSERLVTESCGSPSTNMDQMLMEPTIESIRSSSKSVPNHDIFLTYSEDGRDFAKQLYMNLKASNYYLLNDPNSSNIAEEELIATSIFETTEQDQLLWNNDDYLEHDIVKLLRDLLQGRIKVDDFCRIFSGALDVKNIQNSEGEWKSDHFLFEMQSELSLQKMTSLLENEPLLENQFILQRALNKEEFLQHKYIEWNTFEGMDKEYSKGCITAAIFPKAFLYQFKTKVLYGALSKASNFHDNSCLPMLMGAATEVAKKWKDLCGHEHQSIYIDIEDSIDVECMLSHRGIVGTCKNFHEGEEVGKDLQTGIVQDNLTGVYCCGRINSSTLGGPIHSKAVGAIGMKVTSIDIYVEDMREDGSYYSRTLKDFAYEFGLDQKNDEFAHKQCATKVFGDLEGTSFLKENHGIKCSPLSIIALKSASQRKGLKLTWNEEYGHMEIEHGFQAPKLEVNECQILFTNHVKELGVAIEWGNKTLVMDVSP